MVKTVNRRIACAPIPPSKSTQRVMTTSGSPIPVIKNNLIGLTVVFSDVNNTYKSGDAVYIRGDTTNHNFAREVFELNEVKFILVPEEMIVMREEPSAPVASDSTWPAKIAP